MELLTGPTHMTSARYLRDIAYEQSRQFLDPIDWRIYCKLSNRAQYLLKEEGNQTSIKFYKNTYAKQIWKCSLISVRWELVAMTPKSRDKRH